MHLVRRLEPLLQSIVDHPLSTRQRLDISLAWLRRVHLTLYYDYFECADEADLLARELPWYHRATPSSDGEEAASEEVTESVRQSWSETGLDDMDKKIEARISDGEAQVSEDGSSAATSQLNKAAADEASAVEKSLGISLGFRPLPIWRNMLRAATRQLAILNKDYAVLWTLGEANVDG